MQKIMFEHRRFGLEQAVIARLKEMTRRRVRFPKGVNDKDVESAVMGIDEKGRVYFTFSVTTEQGTEAVDVYPKYQIGEKVAVAQSYKDVNDGYLEDPGNPIYEAFKETYNEEVYGAGYDNKLFVRADLMPHIIEITDIKTERLQNISNEDCLREGIIDLAPEYKKKHGTIESHYCFGESFKFQAPRLAFSALIDRLNGRGTWERNEWQFAYTFKLIK